MHAKPIQRIGSYGLVVEVVVNSRACIWSELLKRIGWHLRWHYVIQGWTRWLVFARCFFS